jgi:hypothetical protein
MQTKYYQLVSHGGVYYSLHEAIYTTKKGSRKLLKIIKTPLRVFHTYHDAVEHWGMVESASGVLDILDHEELVDDKLYIDVLYFDEEE